ncbi:SDR family NAD(P)-dependent oxidoreductase [Effusibacillus dendaii]|uniref:3-oxoacyl-[acyl-carrier-protein] reductase FabG n=1 Tax=Effusibacillus dendaii TaxID=2743772 RepID=A0A7I8DGD0_9BACL|nr:SDR family oxidoreductase [Effusibacillus dendaii]BCJ86861.1 3-oxoacyl-[acyl-carrier-protein] reductase FabG [Effusibacillus dendaii]
MKLKDKICLITNCGDYMGPAITAEFQKEGATVILQSRQFAAAKEQLASHGAQLEGVQVIEADFGARGVAATHIAKLVEERGRLDVLVNVNVHNPGSGTMLCETSDEEWDSMIHALMTELFYTTKAALPYMIDKQKGKIVNVTSAAGIVGLPKYTPYSAARAGANGFTKALGKEVARYNIQVNAIAQNYVENPAYFPNELIGNPDILKKITKNIPLGRLARGEESAKLAVFLASDDSDFFCGEVIKFAGGWG